MKKWFHEDDVIPQNVYLFNVIYWRILKTKKFPTCKIKVCIQDTLAKVNFYTWS